MFCTRTRGRRVHVVKNFTICRDHVAAASVQVAVPAWMRRVHRTAHFTAQQLRQLASDLSALARRPDLALARPHAATASVQALEGRVLMSGAALAGTVIGTSGSYANSGNTRAKAFDNNLGSYFDAPAANGSWVGLDLGSARSIGGIRYAPRGGGFEGRMVGGQFQASNSASFSSGVTTLFTVGSKPVANQFTTRDLSVAGTYRYVRYLAPANAYGNVAEVQVLAPGTAPAPATPAGATKLTGAAIGTAGSYNNGGNTKEKALDGNLGSYFDANVASGAWVGLDLGTAGGVVTQLKFAPRSGYTGRMVGGRFQASNTADFSSGVVTLHTVTAAPAANVFTTVSGANTAAYRYVRYLAPANSYGNIAEFQAFGTAGTTAVSAPTATPTLAGSKLGGTVIGTTGSYANAGNTREKAFDGNLGSYFDTPVGSGAWTGLDLGAGKVISGVRFAPRGGHESRMVGGKFQASNTADFSSGVIDLHAVPTKPAANVLTTATVSNTGTYRYVRYLAPASAYGNVAEVEFWGTASTSTTTAPPPASPAPDPTPDPTPLPVTTTTAGWVNSYSSNPDAYAPKVVLELLGKQVIAGHGVHVDAARTTLSAGTPLTARYQWDFGDPNGNYNTAQGWSSAHVYDAPGTYTVRLTVTDQDNRTSVATQTVNVLPDTRRSIHVAADGNDANSGLSATAAVRSVTRVAQLLDGSGANNVRVLFRRGDTFTYSQGFGVSGTNVVVGAYGTGNRPVLRRTAGSGSSIISMWYTSRNVTVRDITFDSDKPASGNSAPKTGFKAISGWGTNLVFRDCTVLNLDYGIECGQKVSGLLAQNVDAPLTTGLRGYLVWSNGDHHTFLGNRAVNSTREHIVRSSDCHHVSFAHNDFRNMNRNGVDPGDTSKGTYEMHHGSWYYLFNNVARDGGVRVGPRGGSSEPSTTASEWAVFENTRMYGNRFELWPGSHHVMIRNNRVTPTSGGYGVWIGATDGYGRQTQNVHIYNNTVYNPTAYGKFMRVDGRARDVSVVNNLYAAPNLTIGSDGNANLNIADSDLSGFSRIANNVWAKPASIAGGAEGGVCYVYPVSEQRVGYRSPAEWEAYAQVQGDVFATTHVDPATLATTSAVVAGTGVRVAGVFTDAYGNLRPLNGAFSAGAIQI